MASRQGDGIEAKSATPRTTHVHLESARILAVETSGRDASIAALEGDGDRARVVHEAKLAGDRRTAQVLVPGVRELFDRAGWQPGDVQLIAVVVGPGSFTGLRIGVTLAKTLAYATRAEVIGVDALAVLASQIPPSGETLWAIMDAQRQELFAARFTRQCDAWVANLATHIVPQDKWLSDLQPGERVTGPALGKLRTRLAASALVDESLWQPQARAVGQLGWRDYRGGRRDDVWSLAPQYFRASAAEEKRAQRDAASSERSGR